MVLAFVDASTCWRLQDNADEGEADRAKKAGSQVADDEGLGARELAALAIWVTGKPANPPHDPVEAGETIASISLSPFAIEG